MGSIFAAPVRRQEQAAEENVPMRRIALAILAIALALPFAARAISEAAATSPATGEVILARVGPPDPPKPPPRGPRGSNGPVVVYPQG